VHHVALWTHGEVGRDQALSAGEPSVAPGDLPDDRAPLESGVRARAQDAAAERSERDPSRIGVRDAPGLDERALADDLDLRLEARGLPAARRLDAPVNSVGLQQGPERLADGRSSGPELFVRAGDRPGAAPELEGEDELLHGLSSRGDDVLGMSTRSVAG